MSTQYQNGIPWYTLLQKNLPWYTLLQKKPPLIYLTAEKTPWTPCDVIGRSIYWKFSQVDITSGHHKWTSQVDITSGHHKWTSQVDITSGHHKWTPCDVTSGHHNWIFMQKVYWMPHFYFSFRLNQHVTAFDPFGGHSGPRLHGGRVIFWNYQFCPQQRLQMARNFTRSIESLEENIYGLAAHFSGSK